MVKIKLREYGAAGWEWDILDADDDYMGETTWRTNEYGEGLWRWEKTGRVVINPGGDVEPEMLFKQKLGPEQFRLSHNRKSAYQQIRRLVTKKPYDWT